MVVAGEMTTETYVDVRAIVRDTIRDIGYTRAKYGFDAETCGVMVAIDEQSSDIAQGVEESFEAQHGDTDPIDRIGAGDQGMMFGYASRETDELMPLPIMLAHKLTKRLAAVRKADVLPYLRPDGKSQVTVRYEVDEHGRQRPVEIERVLISTQHRDGLDAEALIKPDLLEHVVEPILHADYRGLFDPARLGAPDFFYVNPTGKFVIGGPMGDTGLTGRKIIVDTYGGAAPHGGGAFSGKDPTKVDRSAAYAARYVAKNVVAAGLADRCQVQVAYAIGVAHPMSVLIDSFGTEADGLRSSGSPSSSGSTSTCGPARSSAISTCGGRSTGRPRRTATSAAPTRTSPGSAPTRPMRCDLLREAWIRWSGSPPLDPRLRRDKSLKASASPPQRRRGPSRPAARTRWTAFSTASVSRPRISSARCRVRWPFATALSRRALAGRRSRRQPLDRLAVCRRDLGERLPGAELGAELLRGDAQVLRDGADPMHPCADSPDECRVLLREPSAETESQAVCIREPLLQLRALFGASASRPSRPRRSARRSRP